MNLPLSGPIDIDAPYLGPRLLHRALVVVHFSPVMKIADQTGAGIADFQEAVRGQYPVAELEFERQVKFQLGPDGVNTTQQEQPVWRIYDSEKAWRVSLTRETLALETKGATYTHWADFAARIQFLIRAVGDHFKPAQKLRIGVRFVNASSVEGAEDPRKLSAPELISISGHPDLQLSELLWRFPVDEGALILRTGVLLPGTSHDPGMLEPSEERMWYLDIDVLNEEAAPFDTAQICDALMRHVRRVHAVYKWAIPDPMLDEASV